MIVSLSAIVMMIVGIGIVWGGLALSIFHALKAARK